MIFEEFRQSCFRPWFRRKGCEFSEYLDVLYFAWLVILLHLKYCFNKGFPLTQIILGDLEPSEEYESDYPAVSLIKYEIKFIKTKLASNKADYDFWVYVFRTGWLK